MARASATIAPSPRPGKMNTLLAWPMSCRSPNRSTGSNGDPVATSALPSVHSRMSAGVASATDVGLDSGMIDRSRRRVGHRADDGLGERAGHPGRAHEDLRPDPPHGLEQVRRRAVDRGRHAQVALPGVQVVAAGVDQPARVHGDDGAADRRRPARLPRPAASAAAARSRSRPPRRRPGRSGPRRLAGPAPAAPR